MSIAGLQKVVKQYPLALGLAQRDDVRVSGPPTLDICKDVQFDDTGGVQTRNPYAAMGLAIAGGGTILASDVRRIVDNGGELIMFTKTRLYSWVPVMSAWSDRGEHLAAVLDEEIVFATNGDQEICDRCELAGMQFYAWQDGTGVNLGVRDTATKAIVFGPYLLPSMTRPRLVPVNGRVLLFTLAASGSIGIRSIDPSNIATTAAINTDVAASGAANYDVTPVIGGTNVVGAARITTGSTYVAFLVSSAGATIFSVAKARGNDTAIAVACTRDAKYVQIVRASGNNILGDLLDLLNLSDLRTNDAIGVAALMSSRPQITACYPSTVAAPERCEVYYSDSLATRRNTITTAGTLGTDAQFTSANFLASRAFTRASDANVYVWIMADPGSDGGTVQGSYRLLRGDQFLIARSQVGNVAINSATTAHLPAVMATANADEFAWCGVYKRSIISANSSNKTSTKANFAARAPRDIIISFDANEGRRTARFGRTLYVTGALVLQYDGSALVELNFSIGPYQNGMGDSGPATLGAPGLSAGSYSYKTTLRSMNAQGEVDRSGSYSTSTGMVIAAHQTDDGGQTPFYPVSRKPAAKVAIEYWRTTVNPFATTPFYLISSPDPSAVNPDRYLLNVPVSAYYVTTFIDGMADTTASVNEQHPETAGVLTNLPPPPARIVTATATRLFLSAIAGQPNKVWYSKFRADGKVAAFNDYLTIDVPAPGGSITGIAILNETLIVFRATAIYAFAGQGYDDTGGGTNYADAHTITIDVGATTQDSIVVTDAGLMFQSSKGWHFLSRSLDVQYIGAPVIFYDGETVLSAVLSPKTHQVRIVTSGRCLVYDNTVNQWGEWTIGDGVHSCIWQGAHVYLSNALGPRKQRTDFVGVDYGLDIETGWIDLNELQGEARVWKVLVLGEYRGAHQLRIRIARDYEETGGLPVYSPTYYDDVTWSPNSLIVGGLEQVRHGPSRQECQAIKVRLTAVNISGVAGSTPDNEALRLTAIALELGVKQGLYQRLTAAQKV